MSQKKKSHDPLHVGYGITSGEAVPVCNQTCISEEHLEHILKPLCSWLPDPLIWWPRLSQYRDVGLFYEFGDLQSSGAGQ
jgi:hypothetical protein